MATVLHYYQQPRQYTLCAVVDRPFGVCLAEMPKAEELRRIRQVRKMQHQSTSQALGRGIDPTHPRAYFETGDFALKFPIHKREFPAEDESALRSLRDLDPAGTITLLSCEDFDEDDCNS